MGKTKCLSYLISWNGNGWVLIPVMLWRGRKDTAVSAAKKGSGYHPEHDAHALCVHGAYSEVRGTTQRKKESQQNNYKM